jgi:hypothetical protein
MRHLTSALLALTLATSASATQALDLTTLPSLVVTSATNYVYSASNGPKANILDNDFDTYWNNGSVTGWVQVDFGSSYAFDRIELYGNNPTYVDSYQLFASADGISWGAIASGVYHNEPGLTGSRKFGAFHEFTSGAEPAGRYLRYYASTAGVNAYLGELEVTGHVPVTPAVPEPETWAMLLAGLGLVGFAARRRIS